MMTPSRGRQLPEGKASSEGFSLVELLVAMAVFMLVSAVSFDLFSRHQALLSEEQSTAGLNIGLRNALAQAQLDLVNSGNGLIVGINVPAWPVGVTIQNSNPTAAQCYQAATFSAAGALLNPPVYYAACFDTLNVVLADRNTPPLNPCAASGCSVSTSGSTSLSGLPASPYTAAQVAGNFHAGDQILFVKSCSGGNSMNPPSPGNPNPLSSGCQFTTATLTAVGTVTTAPAGCAVQGCVVLNFTATLPGGANNPCPAAVLACPPPIGANGCNDPLRMSINGVAPAGDLTDTFGQYDWVVRLSPITYCVNASNTADPQLLRVQAGVANPLMDQVIGFKVGAALWNNVNTSTFQYNYSAGTYSPTANEFNLIRSVRVSIIGRTQPNATNPYRNPFDQGPYQIRGNSIIVNPRNLTMNND
jgi:prepilin-type N-terminal cleavage/methylation domain-containing protein